LKVKKTTTSFFQSLFIVTKKMGQDQSSVSKEARKTGLELKRRMKSFVEAEEKQKRLAKLRETELADTSSRPVDLFHISLKKEDAWMFGFDLAWTETIPEVPDAEHGGRSHQASPTSYEGLTFDEIFSHKCVGRKDEYTIDQVFGKDDDSVKYIRIKNGSQGQPSLLSVLTVSFDSTEHKGSVHQYSWYFPNAKRFLTFRLSAFQG
jgi:hypothetical protein